MDVYVKETLYVIDYDNDIPNAELQNMIFTSDDHRTPGYAYNITIKEANTGYSDLTFSMPNTIIDDNGNQIKNPKLALLVPLVKIRYHRQVYYTGEKEITVREPVGYGDTTTYIDKTYYPNYPDNIIEDYIMDYVVQPVDKKRNTLEIATTFTAIDYPRFTLSKKKVGLLIDNDTVTKEEWSIVGADHPIDRPGMIKYIPWDATLSTKVLVREDYESEEAYEAACEALTHWNPMTATTFPLTKDEVYRLKRQEDLWPYGFDATCFYWPIEETGRFKGILYEEGGWIGFQGYDLLGLQIAGLDPELHTENVAWHWTQIYKMENYLTPNTAENYLNYILEGTAWTIDEVDVRHIQTYNPKDGSPDEEVEYTAYLNLSGSNCYNAITTLCQNFQLYPVFDCLHRKVSLKLASGKNYGLVYRLGNNIKSDSTKADGEKVITKLYVSGGSDNVGTANINIGTATRAYKQNLQGFYQYYDPDENPKQDNNLAKAEVKGLWAVVDDSLTNFNTTVYELDYHPQEGITILGDRNVMPPATEEEEGNAYHYVGMTNDDFTNNFCYMCKEEDRNPGTYFWLDVTGEPYLKAKTTTTHGLNTPNYWEAGANRKVYFRDNGTWVEGEKQSTGVWTYGDYIIDPISGMEAPWDPNDEEYIMSRSPYWTNYIMNLRWYYQNNWITKEQILELYQYNLQVNDLNKAFGDKYIEDRRATQTAYENAKNNYDIAQDGFESTLYAMENKYYLEDGDYSKGYEYCFHTAPKDACREIDGTGNKNYFVKLFHCYGCGRTFGIPGIKHEDGDDIYWTEGADVTVCPNPKCPDPTNVVNNKINVPVYVEGRYHTNEKYYPYGTDTTHLYGDGYVGGYKYNPQLKGYYLRLVTTLDKADAREEDIWDVAFFEKNVSLVQPIEYIGNDSQVEVFDQYVYKINNVYVRTASGQIDVWNDAVADYIKYYGQMLDNKLILDASIKHIEELEEVYESWSTIMQGIYERMQIYFGDFIVEGNYQNTDQPYIPILFNEGLEASDKYSVPEITYDLDVVASSGLIEYRRPMITKYTCANCGHVYLNKEPETCVICGGDEFAYEHDIYNDLIKMLHSVGQIVPKAGDYVSIYDEPMGFFGVPGLITEIDRYLDSPIKNTIKVDTSYTDEEQLVGNIINATNTVLSNKDIYARTAILNGDGTIDPDSIKDTLNTSGADISIVSTNGSILLNGSGLRCIDPSNPSNAIKYTGTGIYKTTNLDNENGENDAVFWERMMTPDGINATYINSGTIDTNKINIISGAGSRVLIDKFGLSVKGSTNASVHIEEFNQAKAMKDADYPSDWGNRNNLASFIGIDNKNNPLIYTRGFLVAEGGSNIANWITSDAGFYHLSGNTPDLWLSPTGSKPLTEEGESDTATVNNHVDNYVLYANGNFGVNREGKLYATDAVIEGNITVTSGDIGGFHVTNTQMYGPKAGLSGDNTNDYICPNCGYVSKTTFSTCPECGQDVTPEITPRKWAFWAGTDEAHKDGAPFRVGFDGKLYATDATIRGTIDAESGNIGGWKIGTDKLYSVSGNGKIEGGTISGSSISAGTITGSDFHIVANNKSYVKLCPTGHVEFTNNAGFFSMGPTPPNGHGSSAVATTHPYVSALNVARGAGGIVFSNTALISESPSGKANIHYEELSSSNKYLGIDSDFALSLSATKGNITLNAKNGDLDIDAYGKGDIYVRDNFNITSYSGDIAIENLSKSTSHYVRINKLYACSNSDYTWLVFNGVANSSPLLPRIRCTSKNMVLFQGSGGGIYAGGDSASDKVKTSGGTPSSLNVKTNLKSLDDEYDSLYEEMKTVKAYNYDYKYQNVNGDLTKDYGFIIDEIDNTEHLSHYFRNYDVQRVIDQNTLYPIDSDDERQQQLEKINIKIWDTDSYIKGLFVMIKTLQHKIDELEEKIKRED